MADSKQASPAGLRAGALAAVLAVLSGSISTRDAMAEPINAARPGSLGAGQVAGEGTAPKALPSDKPAARAKASPPVPKSRNATGPEGTLSGNEAGKLADSRPAAPVQVADQQAGSSHDAGSGEVPVADPRRYALVKVDGSYLRLDRVAGTIAFCKPVNGLWRCLPAPDAEAAYLDEIDQLRQENAALRNEIASLKAQPDGTATGSLSPETPRGGIRPAPELSPKDEEQLDEMLTFTEQAMRRFFGLMRDLQAETGR
jgi:hypothetical protein